MFKKFFKSKKRLPCHIFRFLEIFQIFENFSDFWKFFRFFENVFRFFKSKKITFPSFYFQTSKKALKVQFSLCITYFFQENWNNFGMMWKFKFSILTKKNLRNFWFWRKKIFEIFDFEEKQIFAILCCWRKKIFEIFEENFISEEKKIWLKL